MNSYTSIDKDLVATMVANGALLTTKQARIFLGFSSSEFWRAKQSLDFPKQKFEPFNGIGFDINELRSWAEKQANR